MTSKYCEYIFISGLGAHHRAHLNQNDLQSQQPTKTQQKILTPTNKGDYVRLGYNLNSKNEKPFALTKG